MILPATALSIFVRFLMCSRGRRWARPMGNNWSTDAATRVAGTFVLEALAVNPATRPDVGLSVAKVSGQTVATALSGRVSLAALGLMAEFWRPPPRKEIIAA
jgi:hypothetical protein